jgi:two-component system, NarL family, response regulator NreC
MNKIRLLIASDFRLARSGLRQLVIGREDIEVVAESDLRTSLQQVQESSPDVVLLDLPIPEPHNIPAVSQLLKDKQAKVVVMSANENVTYVRSLLAAGVLGYVLRSASEEELFSAIRTANNGRYFIDPQLSDAVADILVSGRFAGQPSRARGGLSNRELQVLAAIARGFTSSEIACQLQLSAKTIETYRARIYEKLGLKSRAELVGYAIATGLLTGTVEETL